MMKSIIDNLKYWISKYHLFIKYGTYIFIVIFVIINVYAMYDFESLSENKFYFSIFILFYLTNILLIYGRFIERNLIEINNYDLELDLEENVKIVVISDLHLGVYKDERFLKKVVNRINEIKKVDFVVIAGDFVYYPYQDLEKIFAPLSKLKYPVYGVLGNHDVKKESSIQDFKIKLIQSLTNNKVKLLHNKYDYIERKEIIILGLGDYITNEDKVKLINRFNSSDNLIVIAHNPDTVLKYSNSIPKLTICGHTHGGQIRIPGIYKKVIPCQGDFDQGICEINKNKIFISSGIGESLLPMRLGIPPSIDILNLK